MYALHVRNDNSASSRSISRNSLDIAVAVGASVDVSITPIERYDISTVAGVLNTIAERDINQVIIGLHRKSTVIDSFFGSKVEQLLKSSNKMFIITRCFIPVNTIRRIVVWLPPQAQFETGFSSWVRSVGNLTREIGCKIIFCCHPQVRPAITGVLHNANIVIRNEFKDTKQWDDFLILANNILDEDLFIVVSARATSVSYTAEIAEMPSFLQKYFAHSNLIVLYPEQFGAESVGPTFIDPMSADINSAPSPLWNAASSYWHRLMQFKKRLTHPNRKPRIN
jgi:hypothetical protein